MPYNVVLLLVCLTELLLLPAFWLAFGAVGLGPLSVFKFMDSNRSYEDIGVSGLFIASCCYTLVTFTIGIVLKIVIMLIMH